MKPESLQALLLDRELGELSAETAELLESWLAEHPDSAAVALPIRRAIETMRLAVRRFPELGQAEEVPRQAGEYFPWQRPLALAASLLIVSSGTAWFGFLAGQRSNQTGTIDGRSERAFSQARNREQDVPWARYEIAANPQGGFRVIRRDTRVRD